MLQDQKAYLLHLLLSMYTPQNWKVLSQAGLKVIDPVGSNSATHIYSFNHLPQSAFVPQTKHGLIQWADQLAPAPIAEREKRKSKRKTWTKKAPTITAIKTQFLNIPSSVDVREANLLPHAIATKNGKAAKGNGSSHHYLAILGTDMQSGYAWLLGLKQVSPGWVQSPELFQDVPSFLVQTNSAKTRFSGNTLVISLGGPNGYELVMPFTDDRFAFSTKEAQDSANAVARQFLMAIQYKRMDLAKVWLSDPKLASIPAYLGLFNRSADSSALRLANMPAPLCGGSRFRLFTGTKDDLIIDVGKIKGQWLIKALFIAPANLGSSITSRAPQINNDPGKN